MAIEFYFLSNLTIRLQQFNYHAVFEIINEILFTWDDYYMHLPSHNIINPTLIRLTSTWESENMMDLSQKKEDVEYSWTLPWMGSRMAKYLWLCRITTTRRLIERCSAFTLNFFKKKKSKTKITLSKLVYSLIYLYRPEFSCQKISTP